MKKMLVWFVVMSFLFTMMGCGSSKEVSLVNKNGQMRTYTFQQYGLFNEEKKNPQVEYRIIAGNVILAIIFVETIIVPIVVIGYYLYEPVGAKIEMCQV